MIIMKVKVLFCFAICVLCGTEYVLAQSNSTSISSKCSKKTFKDMDALIAKMLTFGNSGRKFPENSNDVNKYCDDTKSMVSQIEKMNKNCMKGLIKQVMSITIYSAKKTFTQLCRTKSNNKRMQEMIESSKCLNKANNEIQKCYNNTIDHFISLKQVDNKVKIPMACCAYHKKNICMTKIGDKVNTCSEKQVEIAIRFVESISGNSLNLVCSEYNTDSDKCDQFNGFKPKSDPKLRTKSFFLPLIELFDSFPEV